MSPGWCHIFTLPALRHLLVILSCLLALSERFQALAFLRTLEGGFLLCSFCTMDWQLQAGELFQLEHTLDFFPANEFAAFHANWIRFPFLLSWKLSVSITRRNNSLYNQIRELHFLTTRSPSVKTVQLLLIYCPQASIISNTYTLLFTFIGHWYKSCYR